MTMLSDKREDAEKTETKSGTQSRNDTRDGMQPERKDKSSGRKESSHSRHNQPDHLPLQHRLSLPTGHISPLPSPINQSTPRWSITDPQYLHLPLFLISPTTMSVSMIDWIHYHKNFILLQQISFVHICLPDAIFQPPPLSPRLDSNRQDEYRDFPRTPFPNRSSVTHNQGHSNNSSLGGSYHEWEFEQGRKRWSQGGDEPPRPSSKEKVVHG